MNNTIRIVLGMVLFSFFLGSQCLLPTDRAENKKRIQNNITISRYKKAGYALLALGLLGNAVAYINATDFDPNSVMGAIKSICGYPVPGTIPGFQAINSFCTEFRQKSLVFSLGGILPGISLIWYSGNQKKRDS